MLIELGIGNIAPSAQDPHHDVYTAHLDPDAARPFCLGQCIRGGHAQRGGCILLALDELEAWPGASACAALAAGAEQRRPDAG